jgi:hypothetical protein
MVLGGVGLVVVVAAFFYVSGGGDGGTKATPAAPPAAAAPAGKPAPAPVPMEAAKAGKTPARAAPALTQATLDQIKALTEKAKGLYNEGVTARNGGDNTAARSKQSAAKDCLDEQKKLVETQLLWQEEAQMENWAQPAEYIALEKLYAEASKLEKSIKMAGGT